MSIIDYDNSIEIINSIVDSTNNLIPMLKVNLVLNGTIYITVEQIFRFMKKALSILPDFLIADKDLSVLKNEINDLFIRVIEGWKDFNSNPLDFFKSWENFHLAWEVFYNTLMNVKKNSNLVFISMN